MLKKKKNETQNTEINTPQSDEQVVLPELEQQNPFVEMYGAVKRAILTIKEDPENPYSNPFFKTIAIDTGQFGRILRNENTEYETAFPAIFIHFINVRYLVQQQRIGEGRATMRVRFILNTLNHQDLDRECDPFVVFQRVNIAIQDAKNHEPALNERCNLTYFDMPLSTNMLQGYWIDYEVWFRESSAWKYRDWVEKYLVIPPFTNHDDAPQHDKDKHGNHKKPTDRDVIGIQPSVEDSVDDNNELEDEN
ncbi:MAG: hypothetical protein LBS20_19545 [Prevotella sp.]|jgi:hypothetical protein|nr:hypothetical protein [Prevotella sp.]